MTVVAVSLPFPPDPSVEQRLREVDPDALVVFTPYAESMEVRAEKGKTGGRLALDLPTPPIDDETRAVWAEAEVFVTIDSPDGHAELLPRLAWFQAASAGTDHFDAAGLQARGVLVTTGAGLAADSIAEFVFARFLQVWKNLRMFDDQQREHRWEQLYGRELSGQTLLIVGHGAIGRAVAVRAKAFGMHVIATRRSVRPGDAEDNVDELRPASELVELLGRADAIVSALPASDATTDLYDAAMFAAMKPGVLFQNVGRGPHVVEEDLIAALEAGHVGAALLDVTRLEPVPSDSPLWDAPNLYLSPHSAVSVDRYPENTWNLLVENFARWRAGEPLINQL
ncbi:MAG: D-2-hydroxyacid dehydrogenase [Actinomycetota bacterium]